MAILAEHGNPLGKKILMATAMRRMADETILLRRWMYPDKGTALIDMAGITEQIRGFRGNH